MNTVQVAQRRVVPRVYYPGLLGRHIQGGFYVIFMENDRWMNLASGESYNKDAPIELPPLGTVVTLTVTA